ncbi:hypothetical protein MRX96_021546 [Rhipicephalus microplus]
MYGDLAGSTQVLADGSVLRDGSASAASIAPQIGMERQCRLRGCASSPTAERAALLLAADLLRKSPAVTSTAIF